MSSVSGPIRGYLESTYKFFVKILPDQFENIERIFGTFQHAGELGRGINLHQGNTSEAEKWGNISDPFDEARGALGAVRWIGPWMEFLTGRMFTEPVKITNENDEEIDDPDGRTKWADFIDVIKTVLVLAARTLSPIN